MREAAHHGSPFQGEEGGEAVATLSRSCSLSGKGLPSELQPAGVGVDLPWRASGKRLPSELQELPLQSAKAGTGGELESSFRRAAQLAVVTATCRQAGNFGGELESAKAGN